jgi:hypothetical protein
VAASIRYKDQGLARWAVIWELKDGNGPKQYITMFMYDGVEMGGTMHYQRLLLSPKTDFTINIYTVLNSGDRSILPYSVYLIEQQGYQDAVRKIFQTQNISPELGNMIVVGNWSGPDVGF